MIVNNQIMPNLCDILIENIKFDTNECMRSNSEDLRVLLKSRRFLRVEQQILKSYTGLKHFKFCYNMVRSKNLARTKQVLSLVSQRKGILLPLPISHLLLHSEAIISSRIHVQDLPPLISPSVINSRKKSEESWLCCIEYLVSFSELYTFCFVHFLS